MSEDERGGSTQNKEFLDNKKSEDFVLKVGEPSPHCGGRVLGGGGSKTRYAMEFYTAPRQGLWMLMSLIN